MKQTIAFTDFVEAFIRMGRGEQFSRDALRLIFDYLVEREEDTGTEQELDVIAVCCSFREYESADEIRRDFEKVAGIADDLECVWALRDYVGDVLVESWDRAGGPIVVAC